MPTVREVLQQHFDQYARSHRLSAPQYRAARAMSVCRTATLGGHVQRCPNGHLERVWYNSCRHRNCPQCNGLAREQWLERQRARLIDCAHHHLIFTIAHELVPLWMLNGAALMGLLFETVRDTLGELLADPRYLGAEPGIVLALHTWGRSLTLHPHIHALVTDGGLEQEQWVAPRRSHFLPARAVMHLFRGKFLARLRQLQATGQLHLPGSISPQGFGRLVHQLGRKKWHVFLSARYSHGEGVSLYLARYVKGGPLKNSQLVRATGTEVVLRYRPHGQAAFSHNHHTLALSPAHFLGRLLAHAPEPRRHSVRYYGLYAHSRTAALNSARALHQQRPVETPAPIPWQNYLARFPRGMQAAQCPRCGTPLVRALLLPATSRLPP